jgi:hypothetical protein
MLMTVGTTALLENPNFRMYHECLDSQNDSVLFILQYLVKIKFEILIPTAPNYDFDRMSKREKKGPML